MSIGRFVVLGIILAIFSAGWITGFIELANYLHQIEELAGASAVLSSGWVLVVTGILILIGWWVWFWNAFIEAGGVLGCEGYLKHGLFATLCILLSLFLTGWVTGFLTFILHRETMSAGPIGGAVTTLIATGVSICVGWVVWFIYAFTAPRASEQTS